MHALRCVISALSLPSTFAFLHANGLLEVRVQSGATLSSLDHLERIFADRETASGILLVVEDGAEQQRGVSSTDTNLLASLSVEDRVSLLRREYAVRESLRSAQVPTIAVAAGERVDGSAAGLFLAAKHRLLNERSTFSMSGCRLGLLPSGLSLLGGAAATVETRALAMAVAVGAMPLNAHDAAHVLSARFTPSADVCALLDELRTAPADYLDVPLSRRCEPVPEALTNLFERLVKDAVDTVFGAESVPEMQESIEREHAAVDRLLQSHAWRTRELAEPVCDVLSAAAVALHPQRSSPSALAATFRVLRRCFEADGARAHALELAVNAKLAARSDFEQRMRARVGVI